MKIEKKSKALRLDFFRNLYESAKRNASELHERFDKYMSQYKGSTDIDGSDENAITVRNITYEIVESQISSDIPQPKADATSYSEKRGRNAESIERLCRCIRNSLPFEEMNDIDERYTYIYGGSVWYVEWDNTLEHMGEIGAVRVHCLSPKCFYGQPGIWSVDNMEYCFLDFTTTSSELCRRYGVSDEEIIKAEACFNYDSDPESDAVTMTVCFFKDEDGEIGRYIFSGELVLSDLPRLYHRRTTVCRSCGRDGANCTCEKSNITQVEQEYESLDEDIPRLHASSLPAMSPLIYNGKLRWRGGTPAMGKTRIPYYTPKKFPIVVRKNTSTENSLFGQSDCEYIRPEQQAINKIESRILQKLLRAGITPIVPEDANISVNNHIFGQVIKMKPGESASQYGKVDTTPNISQDIAEAERLYDHAKRTLGISDAYQGIDTSLNESGVAKKLRISQATGRLQSKRKMKDSAYAAIDQLIFELYLAFADEPRHLSYRDAYGRTHAATFNRYDFIEYDIGSGEYYYDDSYLFSVDLNGGSDLEREALWQRNLENLKAGTLGNPEDPITLLRYWQAQERAHYPYARENVEYFTQMQQTDGGGTPCLK